MQRIIDIDGPIHVHDAPGPSDDAPVMVLVHGLGASHVSWHPLIPLLTPTHRVVALDLVGFGGSEPAGRGTTVSDNRRMLVRFLREVVDGPVTLVGNSMGGMISALAAHAHPELVEGLVLVNAALPGVVNPTRVRRIDPQLALHFILYNTPLLGEQFLRLRRHRTTPAQQVHDILEQVCSDPSRIPRATVEAMIRQNEQRRGHEWTDRAFLAAQRSLMRQLTVGRKQYLEVLHALPMPTLVVHGADDRLVNVGTAVAVAPGNPRMDLVVLTGVGHAPQLEAAEELAGAMREWMSATTLDVA